ncbi:MAG: hypothetical protein UMV23_03280 [Halanaerobium sp.]|nr:hypothetical protein [Halanaerobium sp.]
MAVDELVPGMDGIGKTVIHGTEVQEFPVKVIDIIPDPLGDLILIKFVDEKLPEQGLAAGMSGSPVFVAGRLLGAIGYGWSLSDNRLALVTPIKQMLELWEWQYPDPQEEAVHGSAIKEARREISLNLAEAGLPYTSLILHETGWSGEGSGEDGRTLHAFPARTPILVSGMEGRAFRNLQDDLAEMGFTVRKGGANGQQDGQIEVEPGSSVAAQLVQGDVTVASIGTVTYRDENKILAFGHPFLNKGNVNLLLAGAYVHAIVPSLEVPFKLGSPLKPLGVIEQDRSVGISGTLNRFPKIIPVRIKINNLETGRIERKGFQMVKEEDMILTLATNAALQIIDDILQHVGYGTARTTLTVTGSNLPDHKLVRENMYYSSQDIGATLLADFYTFLNLAVNNPFAPMEILNIDLDVELAKTHMVALVEELQIENEQEYYQPGDIVELKVKIRPWRAEPFYKHLEVKIPEDFAPGQAILNITGGSEFYQQPPAEEQGPESLNVIDLGSLPQLIDEFKNTQKNNQLVVQLIPPYTEESYQGATMEQGEGYAPKPEVKELFDLSYVLEGMLSYQLNIQEKSEPSSGHNIEEQGPAAEQTAGEGQIIN